MMTPKCPRCNRNLKEITGSVKKRVKALVCTCGFYYSRVSKRKESIHVFWVSSMLFIFGAIFAAALSLALFPELRHLAKIKSEVFLKPYVAKTSSQSRPHLQYRTQNPSLYPSKEAYNTSTKAQKKTAKKDLKKRSIAKARSPSQHN